MTDKLKALIEKEWKRLITDKDNVILEQPVKFWEDEIKQMAKEIAQKYADLQKEEIIKEMKDKLENYLKIQGIPDTTDTKTISEFLRKRDAVALLNIFLKLK